MIPASAASASAVDAFAAAACACFDAGAVAVDAAVVEADDSLVAAGAFASLGFARWLLWTATSESSRANMRTTTPAMTRTATASTMTQINSMVCVSRV